jgi:hypothetical protein
MAATASRAVILAKFFLFEHIEIFYNRQRHQTALGHMTPVEYAATFTA